MSLSRAQVAFHLTSALANKGVYVDATEVTAQENFYDIDVTLSNGSDLYLTTAMTSNEIHSAVYHATKGA